MKTSLKPLLLSLSVTALTFGFGRLPSNCQGSCQEQEVQIEIVDQDGQSVDASQLKWVDQNDRDAMDIQVGDGKIIIVDGNGERREIDVAGAKSIIVNKSVQSIVRNGEEDRKIIGKAIIVGPDGEKQVIELDGAGPVIGGQTNGEMMLKVMPFFQKEFQKGDLPGVIEFGMVQGGKYMIGVGCEPVSDLIRSQLGIGDHIGLVVNSPPREDSPAAKSGIRLHDILTHADQKELGTIQQLVDAVQEAGKGDREMALTLIRGGKEISVAVKPMERKHSEALVFGNHAGSPDGDFNMRVEKFGPGVIFEENSDSPEELLEKMNDLDRRMKERMEEFSRLQEQFRQSLPGSSEKHNDN